MTRMIGLAALVLSLLMGAARADEAELPKIAGQDAMGDKGRSGPDGWVNAPIIRDQSVVDGPGQAHAANTHPGPYESKPMPPGQDPGTPATTEASGPGTLDNPPKRTP